MKKNIQKRNQLLKRVQYTSLNDTYFWSEAIDYFTPEEVQKLRDYVRQLEQEQLQKLAPMPYKSFEYLSGKQEEGMIGGFSDEELVDYAFEKAVKRETIRVDDFGEILDKHHSGLTSWTEEDEEEFMYRQHFSKTKYDHMLPKAEYTEPKEYTPKNDPMGGGLGLGYDGEEDDDEDF